MKLKVLIAYQKYQNERDYQLYKALLKQMIIQKLYLKLIHSFSTFSISLYNLPAKYKFFSSPNIVVNTPILKKIMAISELKSNSSNIITLPPKPAPKSNILSFTIWYLAFIVSNLKFLFTTKSFISIYHIFNAIKSIFKGICFDVVIQPAFSPFWNFIFSFPSNTNGFWIKATDNSKLFYSEITLLKSLFKSFKIHYNPLKVNIFDNYIIVKLIKLVLYIDLNTNNIIQSKLRKLNTLVFYYSNSKHPKQTSFQIENKLKGV